MHERAAYFNLEKYITILDQQTLPGAMEKARILKEVFETDQFIRMGEGKDGYTPGYDSLAGGKTVVIKDDKNLGSSWILTDIDTVELITQRDPWTIILNRIYDMDASDVKSEDLEAARNTTASEGLRTMGGLFLMANQSGMQRFEVIVAKPIIEQFGRVKSKKIIAYLLGTTADKPNFESIRQILKDTAMPDKTYQYKF